MAYEVDTESSVFPEPVEKPRLILADWDADAGVWVASSGDVPGLVTESDTLEGLASKLEDLLPELLEANDMAGGAREITYELLARRYYGVVLH